MLLFLSLSAEWFDRLYSLTYTKYLYQINLCAQSIKKSEVYGVKVKSAIGRKVNKFCLVENLELVSYGQFGFSRLEISQLKVSA